MFEGGSGCAKVEGKEDSVIVRSTRGCWKASGLKWINTGNEPTANTAQNLKNPRLADALMRKTEFTQQEWDAFGVHDLHMHHFVKSGDSYFHPAGEEQPDVRVLRPLAHYGDFGEDGRVKWGVDDVVVVGEAFTCAVEDRGGEERERELAKETKGTVLRFNEEGAAEISFREVETGKEGKEEERTRWVPKDQFYRLFPLPNARDTPIQRRVKQARLRRCDVLALVLYTGVFVYLPSACSPCPAQRHLASFPVCSQ